MRDDANEAVRAIVAAVTGRLTDEMNAQISRMDDERDALVSAVRAGSERGAAQIESRIADLTDSAVRLIEQSSKASGDAIAQRFADGVRHVTEVGQSQLQKAADEQVGRIEAATVKLSQTIEAADTAAREATAATATLEKERAEHTQAKVEAEAEKVAAQKATALLALAGDVEIARMVKETELRATEKRTIDEMKAKRSQIEDEFDLKATTIQRGVQQYYPELQAELDRLTAEDGVSSDSTEEKE